LAANTTGGQPQRLIYLGKAGNWHEFKKIGDPREVWCYVLDRDLSNLKETAQLEAEASRHTPTGTLSARVFVVVGWVASA
jgi:hypothetical protein